MALKECVPNQLALKMDGAGAMDPYPAVVGHGMPRGLRRDE